MYIFLCRFTKLYSSLVDFEALPALVAEDAIFRSVSLWCLGKCQVVIEAGNWHVNNQSAVLSIFFIFRQRNGDNAVLLRVKNAVHFIADGAVC